MKLSETLFAFNNEIVAIKPVIKKAKVLEIRKLIRKIKQLGQKKGNETQLEKNKKKCINLKHEIQLIKGLKFNEIALFTFENEKKTFDSYIKEKKPKLADDIALSRVGLNKSVVDAVEKIREAHKSDWKALIIAYRSRFEKRRNWKEKRKLLNELDAKLCEEKKDQDDDAESDVDDEEKSQDEDDAESEVADEQNDDESDIADEKDEAESEADDAQDGIDSEIADDKDEDEAESESESESDASDESEVVVEKPVKPSNKKKEPIKAPIKEPPKSKPKPEPPKPKPEPPKQIDTRKEEETYARLISNKPAHMEIRRINLDELSEMSELPIESKTAAESSSYQKSLEKLKKDAFFLDSDGNEIESGTKFDPGLDNRLHEDYSADYSNRRRWNDDSGYRSNNFRSDNSSRPYRSSFNDSSKRMRPDFKERSNWERPQSSGDRRPPAFNRAPRPQPPEDISKLHPSWQAKKLNEQKLSAVQFKGKKIQFDD